MSGTYDRERKKIVVKKGGSGMKSQNKGGGRKIRKARNVLIVFIILLLLSTTASAWFQIVFQVVKDFLAALGQTVSQISFRMERANRIRIWVFDGLMEGVEDLPKLILINPDIMILQKGKFVGNPDVEKPVNFMIGLTIPFYVFGIISTAFYLLFVSGSPMGRARAKSGLLKLILSIPLMFMTIPIIQLLLDISTWITTMVLGVANLDSGILALKRALQFLSDNFMSWVWFSDWPALRHPANAILFGFPVFTVIFMRYFFIIIMTIMFPLTIFLTAFRFTKKLGKTFLQHTVWWIFGQPMMAVILLGISIAAYSIPAEHVDMARGTFGLGGFLALAVAPVITMAIMNWGEMIGVFRDLMYTPWISLAAGTVGLGIESIGEEEVSPPPPIEPPRIPPPPT